MRLGYAQFHAGLSQTAFCSRWLSLSSCGSQVHSEATAVYILSTTPGAAEKFSEQASPCWAPWWVGAWKDEMLFIKLMDSLTKNQTTRIVDELCMNKTVEATQAHCGPVGKKNTPNGGPLGKGTPINVANTQAPSVPEVSQNTGPNRGLLGQGTPDNASQAPSVSGTGMKRVPNRGHLRQGTPKKRMRSGSDSESEPPRRFMQFKVPPKPEDFDSGFELIRAIEKERKIFFKVSVANEGVLIITPRDRATEDFLKVVRTLSDGRRLSHTPIRPMDRKTKMVLLGFPIQYNLEVLKAHPQVEDAFRLKKSGSETRQVLVTWKGPPSNSLKLENWGSFKMRTFVPPPLRCFRCQQYGHHQSTCSRNHKCGICSRAHKTEVCIKAHKAQKETQAKCPNCSKKHHAWSLACSIRREAAAKRLEVAERRPDFIPAPPGQNVWEQRAKSRAAPKLGNKQPSQKPPLPPAPNSTEFPGIGRGAGPSNSREVPQNGTKHRRPSKQRPKKHNASEKAPPQESGETVAKDDQSLTICEKDLDLLVAAVVAATAAVLGGDEGGISKATEAAQMAVTKVVATLRRRRASPPPTTEPISASSATAVAPEQPQSVTQRQKRPRPAPSRAIATSQGNGSKYNRVESDSDEGEEAHPHHHNRDKKPKQRADRNSTPKKKCTGGTDSDISISPLFIDTSIEMSDDTIAQDPNIKDDHTKTSSEVAPTQ